jgi:hypothetical protein
VVIDGLSFPFVGGVEPTEKAWKQGPPGASRAIFVHFHSILRRHANQRITDMRHVAGRARIVKCGDPCHRGEVVEQSAALSGSQLASNEWQAGGSLARIGPELDDPTLGQLNVADLDFLIVEENAVLSQ